MRIYLAERTPNNWRKMNGPAQRFPGLRVRHFYEYDEKRRVLIDRVTFPNSRTYRYLRYTKGNRDLYRRYSNGDIEVRYNKEFLDIYFKKKREYNYNYVHYDKRRRHYYPISVDQRRSEPYYISKGNTISTTTDKLSKCLSRHITTKGKGFGKRKRVVMETDDGYKYLKREL